MEAGVAGCIGAAGGVVIGGGVGAGVGGTTGPYAEGFGPPWRLGTAGPGDVAAEAEMTSMRPTPAKAMRQKAKAMGRKAAAIKERRLARAVLFALCFQP